MVFLSVTWITTKGEGVKSGRSGVHKPGKLEANKCSDAGTEDLDVLTTYETADRKYRSPCIIDYPLEIS